MPQRIQRRRTAGWRMPDGAIFVGRPGRWGNPYRAIGGTMYGPRQPRVGGEMVAYQTHAPAINAVAAAVDAYRRDIDCAARSDLTTALIREHLRGHDLSCWCRLDQPCHGDVLLFVAAGGVL